jgi:hypothetical protein
MSTGNSSNKLWRRRDVIKLLGATAITGPVIFRGTTANAATSKVVASQWRKRDNGFELVICEDTSAPNIKAQDKLRLLN